MYIEQLPVPSNVKGFNSTATASTVRAQCLTLPASVLVLVVAKCCRTSLMTMVGLHEVQSLTVTQQGPLSTWVRLPLVCESLWVSCWAIHLYVQFHCHNQFGRMTCIATGSQLGFAPVQVSADHYLNVLDEDTWPEFCVRVTVRKMLVSSLSAASVHAHDRKKWKASGSKLEFVAGPHPFSQRPRGLNIWSKSVDAIWAHCQQEGRSVFRYWLGRSREGWGASLRSFANAPRIFASSVQLTPQEVVTHPKVNELCEAAAARGLLIQSLTETRVLEHVDCWD